MLKKNINKLRKVFGSSEDLYINNKKQINQPIAKDITLLENPRLDNDSTEKKPIALSKEAFFNGKSLIKKVTNLKKESFKKANICMYTINKKHDTPFLLFNLVRTDTTLGWLNMNIKNKSIDDITFKLKNVVNNKNAKFLFDGVYRYEGEVYLWFEYSNYDNIVSHKKKSHDNFMCLPYEIVNTARHMMYNVDINVHNFFIMNKDFLYLSNDLGNIYEPPIVAYYNTHYKTIGYASTFGNIRDIDNFHGPYFYYYTYDNAMKKALATNVKKNIFHLGKRNKQGILRIAMFMGKSKVFLQRTNNDNHWDHHYDSAYISYSNINSTPPNPDYVIKDKKNSVILDYCYVNTSNKAIE